MTPTPPKASASQRAPPQARALRPHPQTAAVPLTPSFRLVLPTPTWPCCSTRIMRPHTDSRQLILILLAPSYQLRRACTPAPCSQPGLPRLRLLPINQRVLLAHHYLLRDPRKEWFPITGTPLLRRQGHQLPKALQCSRARPNRRITSSILLPRLLVIPRIGRRIPPGRRRRQRAIRHRRRPDLLLLPSALARSHLESRRRLRQETRARTAWRHRERNNHQSV